MEQLQDRLKSHPSFELAHHNGIAWLRIIKVILYSLEQVQHQENKLMTINMAFLHIQARQ